MNETTVRVFNDVEVDEGLRLVLPKEFCEMMNISPGNTFEIRYDTKNEVIALYKNGRRCVVCGQKSCLFIEVKKVCICRKCVEEIVRNGEN